MSPSCDALHPSELGNGWSQPFRRCADWRLLNGRPMKFDRRNFLTSLVGAAAFSNLNLRSNGTRSLIAPTLAGLALDPRRPQFHFLPAANWMNDPNGPIYWKGSYHMFYQYNPNGAFWGDMHWGHAVSSDMVHWKHLPVALSPTPGGADADGCFTGTAVIQNGQVEMMYTGVRSASEYEATIKDGAHSLLETQCFATSTDPQLVNWTKLPVPVIAAPPRALQVNGFRDPSPWRQGDWWYTVIGSGVANQGGAVLLYKSKDLRNWEYVHVLAGRNQNEAKTFDPYDPWDVWECPEFFALGSKHVLICSTGGKAYWQSGQLTPETMQFHAEQSGILDYGSFYAPKTQLDKSGNRILWGWIQETRPLEQYKAAGWAGMMSLPRVLTLSSDGKLKTRVATEVNALRKREELLDVSSGEEKTQRQIDSMRINENCGEILCSVRRTSESFSLSLLGSVEALSPWLTIKYDPNHSDELLIDARPIPAFPGDRENIELQLYVDSSVIEIFVNQQSACTKRFYPSGDDPQDLRLKWTGKTTNIAHLSVWQVKPISADRLTS